MFFSLPPSDKAQPWDAPSEHFPEEICTLGWESPSAAELGLVILPPMTGDAGGTHVRAGGGRVGDSIFWGEAACFWGRHGCGMLAMLLVDVPLAATVTKVILVMPLNGKKTQSLPQLSVFA